MSAGIWVLNVFAALWGMLGIANARLPRWCLVLPPALSAGLIALCTREAASVAAAESGRDVGRVVGLWSGVEGVAIFLAAFLLGRLGRRDLIVPVVGIIVGLHFFPLALGLPEATYYATGAAMVSLGLGALLLPSRFKIPVTGLGSALILWASVLAMSYRR